MKQLKYTQFVVMAMLTIVGIAGLIGAFYNPFHIGTSLGCFLLVLTAYTSKWF